MQSRSANPPRSSSRSAKRSTTNLADLRLSPLTVRYEEPALPLSQDDTPKTPYDDARDFAFSRNHSSYIQGRSAPTSPGILSRSSSRKTLGAGLSRRTSLYDEAEETVRYHYGGGAPRSADSTLDPSAAERGSGRILKAKIRKPQLGTTGTTTPRAARRRSLVDEDWLTRTHAATHAIVQEAKGQSWLASHTSSTTLTNYFEPSSDLDDLDEGYEELAALSAQHQKQANRAVRLQVQLASGNASPSASRAPKSPGWGSRYGSRTNSRRRSRRQSPVGSIRAPTGVDGAGDDYFGGESTVADLIADEEEVNEDDDGEAEAEVARLAKERGSGLNGFVDRLLFGSGGGQDGMTTDDEGGGEESAEHVKKKRASKRGKDSAAQSSGENDNAEEGGIWQDTAWLLNTAAKVLF